MRDWVLCDPSAATAVLQDDGEEDHEERTPSLFGQE